MIIRRILSFIFSLILMLNYQLGITDYSVPVTVEGAIFSGSAGDRTGTELKFDNGWVTLASNRIYNKGLAAFSAVLCADSYFRDKDLAKGTQNRVVVDSQDEYSRSALLENIGYTDVRIIETFKEKQYSSDSNDSATITIGYKKICNKYDSYIIVLRGCFSIQERLSIFDAGSDTADYTGLTGEHPEWINKNLFKGLDISANRAMEFINAYMSEHDDPECADTALITGHSRGAALANVIGADFERNGTVKSYTYTFNAMPVTSDPDAGSYKTIYNIFDVNDYYTDPLPFPEESFFRYGKNITADISGSEKIINGIAELKGRDDYDSLSPGIKAEYDKLFGRLFPDRASLYEMKRITETYETREEAQARADEYRNLASGLGAADFCTVPDVTETGDGRFIAELDYCGAALLYAYAEIQAYGEAAYDGTVSLFRGDSDGCRIAGIINENLSSINAGHLLINGYVMSEYRK